MSWWPPENWDLPYLSLRDHVRVKPTRARDERNKGFFSSILTSYWSSAHRPPAPPYIFALLVPPLASLEQCSALAKNMPNGSLPWWINGKRAYRDISNW